MKTADDHDITVTSATQSEAQLAADLGLDVPKPADPPPVDPAAKVDDPAPPADDAATVEAELDKLDPPTKPNETPEEQRQRRGRQTGKVLKEIALRKQAEERATKAETELAALRAHKPPVAPAPPAPAAVTQPAAPATAPAQKPGAPTFTFATFEEFQEQHPEADIRDYTIALSDARDTFRENLKAAEAQRAAHETAISTFQTAEQAFKAAHPDYDEKLTSIKLPPDGPNGERNPLTRDLEALVTKAGKDGAPILYFLGTHPEEAARLMAAENKGELLTLFGEMRFAARAAQTAQVATPPAEPKPAAPLTPQSRAPAPVSGVPGSTTVVKTAADLADEEDADAYIAKRQSELRPQRRAG